MSNLVLEIKQGEMMIVNGAAIRFRTKTRIELTSRARFLFGKQLMAPAEATTPARRIYYTLQTAYVGNEDERGIAMQAARDAIEEFRTSTASAAAQTVLERVLEAAMTDRHYLGLKLARRIVRYEDAQRAGSQIAEDELLDQA